MNKKYVPFGLLMVIFCSFQVSLHAQKYYQISKSKKPYQFLVGGTPLPFDPSQDGTYVSMDLEFPVLGKGTNFNPQSNPVPSAGAYFSPDGYIALYETPKYENTIALQCFFNSSLNYHEDFSELSAKIEGTGNTRKVFFQFKDLIAGTDTSIRLNFQIVLDVATSSIHYHYGPNTLKGEPAAGYIGFIVLEPNFSDLDGSLNLTGNWDSLNTVIDIPTAASLPFVNDIPGNGDMITFTPSTSASVAKWVDQLTQFTVYPNPSQGSFTIKTMIPQKYQILNHVGQTIHTVTEIDCNKPLQLDLPAGTYFVKDENGQTNKLVISQ